MNGFQMAASDASRIVDVYSELAGIAATDTSELAVAMSKTSAIANSAGMSFEATSAMLTQMIEQTREAPEALGTALKTIISRFQEMKSNPTQLLEVEGDTASLNKMDTALASVGISLKDANGQFRDLDDVIFELSKIWDTLDRNTQRWIANTAAGSRQQSRMISLVSDSERLQELYTAALDSEDAALVQYSKSLDSMESKLNQLSTSFQQFYMQIFNGETLKAAVEYLTQFVDKLNEIGPVGAIAIAGSLISALSSIGMAMSTKIAAAYKTSKEYLDGRKAEVQAIGDSWWDGFVANFVPKVQAATNQAVQVIQNTQNQTNTTNTTGTTHLRRSGLNDGKAAGSQRVGQQLDDINKKTNDWKTTLKGVASNASKLAPAFSVLSTILYTNANAADEFSVHLSRAVSLAQAGFGIAQIYSGQVAAGLLTFVSGVSQLAGSLEQASEEAARYAKNVEKTNIARATAKSSLTDLDSAYKKYTRLRDAQYESNEAYNEWISYNKQLISQYPGVEVIYNAQGDAILQLADNFDILKQSAENAYKASVAAYEHDLQTQASQPYYGLESAGVFTNLADKTKNRLDEAYKASQKNGTSIWTELARYTTLGGSMSNPAQQADVANLLSRVANDSSLSFSYIEDLAKKDTGLFSGLSTEERREANAAKAIINQLGLSTDFVKSYNLKSAQITTSGNQNLQKQASANAQKAVNDKIAKGELTQELGSVILNKVTQDLEQAVQQENFATEGYDTYNISNIETTLDNIKTELLNNFGQDVITQAQSIADTKSQLSYDDYNQLDPQIKTALEQIYGIKEATFLEPIDNIANQLISLSGNVDKLEGEDSIVLVVKDLLSSLPNNILTYVRDSFKELDSLSSDGRAEGEVTNILSQYIDLLYQLKDSDIDANTLATLLSDADFTTRSGWQAFLDALTVSGETGAEIAREFENVPNMISVSMADAEQGLTSLQTAMTSAADVIKDLQGSDSEKKLAAYKTLNNLMPDYTQEIMALAKGEDPTGEITQKVYEAYISKVKENLQNIIDSLRASGVTDDEEKELQAIEAMMVSFDSEVANAAGTRATNIVSLVLSQIDDIINGKSSTFSRNDVQVIEALAEAGNIYAQEMRDMLTQTGTDTFSIKEGVTANEWAMAVSGLAGSVEESGMDFVNSLKNKSQAAWDKAIHDANMSDIVTPLIDAVSDSGEISFGKDIYKYFEQHFPEGFMDKFSDELTTFTDQYDFNGTVKEWFDIIQYQVLPTLFDGDELEQVTKDFQNYRDRYEASLEQSRSYHNADLQLEQTLKQDISSAEIAEVTKALIECTGSADDAREAIKRFGLEANQDFFQTSDGKYGLTASGKTKIGISDLEDRQAILDKISDLQANIGDKTADEIKKNQDLLAIYKAQLEVLNERQQKVATDSDNANDLLDAPEEFAKNVISLGDSLKQLGQTGYIEIETLSNYMRNLGENSQFVKTLGKELDLPAESIGNVSKTIDALYTSTSKLKTIDGKAMINLGANLASMLTNASSVDLKGVAQSNIDMLDGMIATLEALKALEDIGGENPISTWLENMGLSTEEAAEVKLRLDCDVLANFSYENGTPVSSIDELWGLIQATFVDDEDFWLNLSGVANFDFTKEENRTKENLYASIKSVIDFIQSNPNYAAQMGINFEPAVTIDTKKLEEAKKALDIGDTETANTIIMKVLANTEEAKKDIDNLRKQENQNPINVPSAVVTSNSNTAGTSSTQSASTQSAALDNTGIEQKVADIAKKIQEKPVTITTDADTKKAEDKIVTLKETIEEPANLELDPDDAYKTTEETVGYIQTRYPELTIRGDNTMAIAATKAAVNYINSQIGTIQINGQDNVTPLVNQILSDLANKSVDIQVNMIYGRGYKNGTDKRGQDAKNGKYSAKANGDDGVAHTGKALVGELGPELVVHDDTYRVVGQYGAEFVNLSRGDVVFNASDTARLLQNKNGARGTALVNGTGSAYASGLDSAINALKEARAAWSSILSSVPDMLKKGSGGGGGGGGSSDEDEKEYLMQLEKWFNWLRRIEELENRITVLRAKRENIKDGKQYADSLYEENAYLQKQSELYAGLIEEQKAYRKQLQDDYLKNYSKYFYFIGDAIQINADAILADTKNNEELGDKIQDLIDDYKDVTEQITDNTEKLEENKTQMDENIRTLRDKYIDMENEILDALKNMYQKEIDAKQDALDKMKDADDAYLDSLKKNLDKEKSLREKSKTQEEKQTLQRKIALLSRDTSGANAKELADLRQQLRDMQEEQYFNDREDAITSAEDATQAQQDALQKEIDNLTEANNIKLENMRLYWAEVEDIINQGSESILTFLQSYSDSYMEMSKIQQEDYTSTWKQTIDAALEYAKDMKRQFDEIIAEITEAINGGIGDATGGLDGGSSGNSSSSSGSSSGGSSGSSGNGNGNGKDKDNKNNSTWKGFASLFESSLNAAYEKLARIKDRADSSAYWSAEKDRQSTTKVSNVASKIAVGAKIASSIKSSTATTKKKIGTKKYASGGLVDYTGIAQVDGTPTKPEAFLSNADTNLLANFLKAAHSLELGLSSSSSVRDSAISGAPTVNVDSVEINITQAELKDDADLNKLSQDLSQKFLMDIARQSGNISVSRR